MSSVVLHQQWDELQTWLAADPTRAELSMGEAVRRFLAEEEGKA